jgi:hypothetical protein
MNLPAFSIANPELFELALKIFEQGQISSGKAPPCLRTVFVSQIFQIKNL